jgi:peptidoglycan/LPS O-acetylase OafA/YrhL
MTNQESGGTLSPWLRTGWSWLLLAADAAIGVVWLVTIASALSGDWPAPRLWVMLLGATGMLVSRRIRSTHPKLSEPLFLAATIVMIVAMFGLPR